MFLHEKYNLTKVINAAGPFSPVGVSRSSENVKKTVAAGLSDFFIINELQNEVDKALCKLTNAESGTITHCTASSITLSVAATMTGCNQENILALPNINNMPNRVIIPTGHSINYGQSILQAIRLSGAKPILVGTEQQCTINDIEKELYNKKTACLLLVSSRLTKGSLVDLFNAVEIAHHHNIPVIIDAAAQDMRINELLSTKANLILLSAQKYLASPTAGIVLGNKELVKAVRDQSSGIGRAMKATKESICGVLAAIEDRANTDRKEWIIEQNEKVSYFLKSIRNLSGITAKALPDSSGMPFSRVHLVIDPIFLKIDAKELAQELKSNTPSIWVIESLAVENQLILELVSLKKEELIIIKTSLEEILKEKINKYN